MYVLTTRQAVKLLFGDQIYDPDFDPTQAQFRSGADVCEALASHFHLDSEEIANTVQRITHVEVRIENGYEDGHESSEVVLVPAPQGQDLDEWWDEHVYPFTGDGHGLENPNLNSVAEATIITADDLTLVGLTHEWS